MRIKVHVQGIKGSGTVKKDEEPSVLLHGILEVGGHLMDEVEKIEVVFSGGDFVTVKPHLMPGSFEVVTHTDESWPELIQSLQEQHNIYSGSGKVIVEKSD